MNFGALCSSLSDHQDQMMAAIDLAIGRDPNALSPWAGHQMAVGAFLTHVRSEFTLHRWDLVGDDEVSIQLLSQPELTAHAVLAPNSSAYEVFLPAIDQDGWPTN
jgi:hypothetical protein